MGQILVLPFDVQKLPGFRFGTLPPDSLTGGTLCPAGALPQSPEMHSLCNVSLPEILSPDYAHLISSNYRSQGAGALETSAPSGSGLPLTWKCQIFH